ncbi:MAG: helix-turn-helix domain-containing protein [Candidatus Aminicenantes bacterium]|nr:helix-turn-helix domain-containing protein [Candidatus Aminicenantes bacterium]
MDKKHGDQTIHQKMEAISKDIVDKEIPLDDTLKEFEKVCLEAALKKYKGNITKIAKALGVHRNTLHNRIKVLRIKKI